MQSYSILSDKTKLRYSWLIFKCLEFELSTDFQNIKAIFSCFRFSVDFMGFKSRNISVYYRNCFEYEKRSENIPIKGGND